MQTSGQFGGVPCDIGFRHITRAARFHRECPTTPRRQRHDVAIDQDAAWDVTPIRCALAIVAIAAPQLYARGRVVRGQQIAAEER